MKKKTFNDYKKATMDIIKEVRSLMFLNHWNINVDFSKEDCEEEKTAAAKIEIQNKYLSADITFYLILYEIYKINDIQFAKTIIHELSHIITEPLYLEGFKATSKATEEYLETIREQTTEQIASIIYNLWKTK